MAVSALIRLSEDKVTRQEYLRRQDDILLQNKRNIEYNRMKREIIEQGATIAEKDAIIAELRTQLDQK